MRIGLIDVDGHNYPNLVLMKLSAYHKKLGNTVEWWDETAETYDRVYMAKVFSEAYTKDLPTPENAREVIRGGQDMPSGKRETEKSTTKKKTRLSRQRSKPSILIIPYIQSTPDGEGLLQSKLLTVS